MQSSKLFPFVKNGENTRRCTIHFKSYAKQLQYNLSALNIRKSAGDVCLCFKRNKTNKYNTAKFQTVSYSVNRK